MRRSDGLESQEERNNGFTQISADKKKNTFENALGYPIFLNPCPSVLIRCFISVVKSHANMEKIFAENILQGKVAFVTGGGTGITGGVAK